MITPPDRGGVMWRLQSRRLVQREREAAHRFMSLNLSTSDSRPENTTNIVRSDRIRWSLHRHASPKHTNRDKTARMSKTSLWRSLPEHLRAVFKTNGALFLNLCLLLSPPRTSRFQDSLCLIFADRPQFFHSFYPLRARIGSGKVQGQ